MKKKQENLATYQKSIASAVPKAFSLLLRVRILIPFVFDFRESPSRRQHDHRNRHS